MWDHDDSPGISTWEAVLGLALVMLAAAALFVLRNRWWLLLFAAGLLALVVLGEPGSAAQLAREPRR